MHPSLLLLADGRFPAGGHTNSAGVEAAVALGDATDLPSLECYLAGRLATTGRVDAAFAAHSAAAASRGEVPIDELSDELDARILSPHLRSASRMFGRQLLRAGTAVWASPVLDALAEHSLHDDGVHQPLVLGALTAAADGTPDDAAAIAVHHLASAVTTAGVRLLGLDPMAAAAVQQRSVSSVMPSVDEIAGWAAAAPADLPADGGSLTEILGDDHARWDARLFVA